MVDQEKLRRVFEGVDRLGAEDLARVERVVEALLALVRSGRELTEQEQERLNQTPSQGPEAVVAYIEELLGQGVRT